MVLDQKNTNILLTILVICGMISSVVFIMSDILASTIIYAGYDYTSQQVSELSAVNAPSRSFWIVSTFLYSALVIAFSFGIWLSTPKSRSLRVTSMLLALYAILGIIWVLFFPMHERGTVELETDIMHIVMTVLQLAVMLLFISFAAYAESKNFRIYSIATLVAMISAGAIVGTQVNAIAAGQTTPWMGLLERVSVYSPVVWIFMLAFILWTTHRESFQNKNLHKSQIVS